MSASTLTYPAMHPFPARMAPDLVTAALARLTHEALVLDPMMGSGSFPLAAGRAGHYAVGIDTDPMALLLAQTGRCLWDADSVLKAAERVVRSARKESDEPYAHADLESDLFIDYWFDPLTKRRLGALARSIQRCSSTLSDPLWVAFSRLIITKDSGASRARDVSHSRPHRVREEASFDPILRFDQSVRIVLSRALASSPEAVGGRVRLIRGDARAIPLADACVDLVMTSPPYLTAIDYLRGHRLSLVWMGHTTAELRALRGNNIGAERAGGVVPAHQQVIMEKVVAGGLPARQAGILRRYTGDIDAMLSETRRVLKAGAVATFVVADAVVAGSVVDITNLTRSLGEARGLSCVRTSVRALPGDRRYLPTPNLSSSNDLARRMRSETILCLQKT